MDDVPQTGTPVLRRMNRAAVLGAVRQRAPEPVRLTELTTMTALTRPTVTNAVEDLLAAGLLQQLPPAQSELGRPAIRYALNGRASPVLGLDVGPHTVAAGVADLAGMSLALVHRSVRRRGARRLLEAVDNAIDEAVTDANMAASSIAAVVAATPGIVQTDTGRVLLVPSVPGWSSIDLAGHLRNRFECQVLVENDANLAAVAIARERIGSGTLLAVQWGERLGAGVVIDGRLHRGTGEAGEIGFIQPASAPVDENDGRGPLERAISGEAIAGLGSNIAAMHPDSRLKGKINAASVFTAAADGDPAAVEVVDRVASVFAQAIAPAVLVLAPDAVVISGGIARAGDVLVEAVARHLDQLTLSTPAVELSVLAEDTVLTGAITMALDQVWDNLLAQARDQRPSIT